MKKVLIVTYYWPPSGGAGVQRNLKFAKYLRDFGWEPVIYTVENGEFPMIDNSLEKDIPKGITVIKKPIWEPYNLYKWLKGKKKDFKISSGFVAEEGHSFIDKISIWVRGNFFIPDPRIFWVKPSVKFLSEYIKANNINAIVTSGPPHSMHLIGLGLKKKIGVPWIADFRDHWGNFYFFTEMNLSKWAYRKHLKLEKEVINNANSVLVVSQTMKTELKAIADKNIVYLTNGYDEDDMMISENIKPDKKFSLIYTGTIVTNRNPIVLWQALSELVNENKDFANDLEIKLTGKFDIAVMQNLELKGLIPFSTIKDYVPHREISVTQQQAQVLLLLLNDTPSSKGILSGKLFEYLASGRPILCIGPEDGDAAQIIQECNAGVINNYSDVQSLKKYLLNFYQQYKNGTLKIESKGFEKYSRRNLTGELAKVLDGMVK